MLMIDAPRLPAGHDDRFLDCEIMLEPAFERLADAAVVVGWTEDEVEAALLRLMQARIRSKIRRRASHANTGGS